MQKYSNYKKIITLLVVCLLICLCPPFSAQAMEKTASLFLLPDYNYFLNPDYLIIDLIVDPGGKPVNAVNIKLSFPFSKLTLVNINKEQSFCSFFINEKVSNEQGEYNLTCGTPGEIFTKTSVLRLSFQKLEAGWAKIKIREDSSVLARDGLGTDILGSREINNLYIVK
jgi:hypothetical protein